MMKRTSFRLFGLILAALWLLPASAQNIRDGSIYSRYGLGDLHTFASSQLQAMGGSGLGLRSFGYVNFGNPAAFADQFPTRLSLGALYQGVEITDANDNRSRLSTGSLNAVQFTFPIKSNKIGVGFGFQPYSRINYRVERTQLFDPASNPGDTVSEPADTTTYRVRFAGNGGLQQISGGVGYRFNNWLAVGATAQFVFGLLTEEQEKDFTSTAYAGDEVRTSTRFYGVTGTLGVLAHRQQVLREFDELAAGLTLTLPARLNGSNVQTIGSQFEPDTVSTLKEGVVRLPWGVRGGLAYTTDSRWTLVADAWYEPWSNFESDFNLPGYTVGGDQFVQDRVRFSAGLEVVPGGRDLLARYLARTAYRIGFYYDRAYITPTAGADVNIWAITGGLSLPALFSGTRIDINLEAGTRGTAENTLVRDRFIKVGLNVKIGERWFNKPKLR